MEDDFEWDGGKAASNIRKHGVTFEEARSVFGDPLAATLPDPRHSRHEARSLTVGWSDRGRLLVVSHTVRGLAVRIISARMATKHERQLLEQRRS